MSVTDIDVKDNVDMENQAQTKTPSPTTHRAKSASPSCATLLVIDDSSNSEESPTRNSPHIPTKPAPVLPAQTSDIPPPILLPPSTPHVNIDFSSGTADQQRRRNSSIAKLLGGQPLNNHQYEEINQQVLDDQSAQNANNNSDNGMDIVNQRLRSSITRTLLMNSERTNSFTKSSANPQATSSSPTPRDFEYLIRQEVDRLDNDHSASIRQRNNSAPKLIQNLTSSGTAHAQLSTQSKLKRKRSMLTPPVPASNMPTFSLHEPFELQSTASSSLASAHHSHSTSELLHFDPVKRLRHPSHQQYNLPVNPSTSNPSSYAYPKLNMNSSLYSQFNVHRDSLPSANCSPSYPYPRFPQSTKSTLPSPMTHFLPPANRTTNNNNTMMTSSKKAKSIFAQSEEHEPPRQRSYSNTFIQSDSSSSPSSEPNVPLKKRLLHAYESEQRPTTPL